MIPDDPPAPSLPIEEALLTALLAFDEALAAGLDLDATLPFVEESPTDPSWHEARACLRILEDVWPRQGLVPAVGPDERLGRFTIVRELGRGGFGVVFLAVDRVLNRRVALKVPRPEVLATPEVARRFLREAEAASRLDHPNIVPVYETGRAGAACFIASAYCEGPTLADWLRQSEAAEAPRRAARLVATLATAMEHAHERGILHRDLKPSNILLQRRAPGGPDAPDEGPFLPRICDFGLARLLDQEPDETRTGVPVGSPAYMAPEQAEGRPREYGPPTDVYALGVILHELLTGRPPFRGETPQETLRQVLQLDPTPPRQLRPAIPRDLETICLKCLEKRPGRRYATALGLADDLRRYLDGRPILARPVPPWERAGKWARRRPAAAALAAGLVLTVLAAIGGLAWSRDRERRHGEELLRALALARKNEQEAQAHKALAEHRERVSQQHWVASQIRLAQSVRDRGEVEPTIEILDGLRDLAGPSGPRGFAWDYLNRLCRRVVEVRTRGPGYVPPPVFPPDARMVARNADGTAVAVFRRRGEDRFINMPSCACYAVARVLGSEASFVPISLETKPFPPAHVEWLGRVVREASGCASARPIAPESINRCAAFSPDGRTVALIGPLSELHVWSLRLIDAGSGRVLSTYSAGDASGASDLAFMPDGRTVIVGGPGPKERLWHVDGRPDPPAPSGHRAEVWGLAFAPDGRTLASSGDEDHDIKLWDVATGAERSTMIDRAPVGERYGSGKTSHGSLVTSIAYSPDGARLASGSFDRSVKLWKVDSDEQPVAFLGHTDRVRAVAFSPDGAVVASGGNDATVRLWDVAARGARGAPLTGHTDWIFGVAFTPDGTTLVSASLDGTIRLWDWRSGRVRATWTADDQVLSLAISADGRTLATTDPHGNITLRDVTTGAPRPPLRGHSLEVLATAFSPDGLTLASAGRDQTVRVWDVLTGQELLMLQGHGDRVHPVAFSPDGSILASGSHDGTIRLWRAGGP
jgi:WD40 repeat protein/tRNA A-37 threonylcarbamoyl transferase component Bud32